MIFEENLSIFDATNFVSTKQSSGNLSIFFRLPRLLAIVLA